MCHLQKLRSKMQIEKYGGQTKSIFWSVLDSMTMDKGSHTCTQGWLSYGYWLRECYLLENNSAPHSLLYILQNSGIFNFQIKPEACPEEAVYNNFPQLYASCSACRLAVTEFKLPIMPSNMFS